MIGYTNSIAFSMATVVHFVNGIGLGIDTHNGNDPIRVSKRRVRC